MELRLKGYGTIEITNATLVDGGDIMIEIKNQETAFDDIARNPVKELHLCKCDDGEWLLLITMQSLENPLFDIDDSLVLEIESQDEVHRLKALL